MVDKKTLTAPCGLDCFNCKIYAGNLSDETATEVSARWGVPKEAVGCRGCRQEDGKHFHTPQGCPTLDCAKAKGVEFCSDCWDFPCELLAPVADGADRYVHNVKVYNLCRIKNIGIERWIEEASQTRERYLSGKFLVGRWHAELKMR